MVISAFFLFVCGWGAYKRLKVGLIIPWAKREKLEIFGNYI